MNRVDRLFAILTTLQSRKYATAEYISDKFDISVRTVYRDIKALAEIGIPVSFETHKGYFVVQGYFLPPASFTNEEANALILMVSLAEKFADRSIAKHSDSAVSKIKAILKTSQKTKVDELHEQIKVYKAHTEKETPEYLTEIQNAIINKQVLEIEYKNNLQEESKREVEPIGLVFYSMDWHLIAWCWKRNEYRDFKTSRILNMSCGSSFRKPDHIDLNKYIKALH
jgi:predicted DNA-binding transcriptional regulator YafY